MPHRLVPRVSPRSPTLQIPVHAVGVPQQKKQKEQRHLRDGWRDRRRRVRYLDATFEHVRRKHSLDTACRVHNKLQAIGRVHDSFGELGRPPPGDGYLVPAD